MTLFYIPNPTQYLKMYSGYYYFILFHFSNVIEFNAIKFSYNKKMLMLFYQFILIR